MTRTMRVLADASKVSMAASIRAMASVAPLFVLSTRALAELAAELGGYGEAATYVLELAEANHRPIAVNIETGADTSSTAFIAPQGWGGERLRGWIAGHYREFEPAFGEEGRR